MATTTTTTGDGNNNINTNTKENKENKKIKGYDVILEGTTLSIPAMGASFSFESSLSADDFVAQASNGKHVGFTTFLAKTFSQMKKVKLSFSRRMEDGHVQLLAQNVKLKVPKAYIRLVEPKTVLAMGDQTLAMMAMTAATAVASSTKGTNSSSSSSSSGGGGPASRSNGNINSTNYLLASAVQKRNFSDLTEPGGSVTPFDPSMQLPIPLYMPIPAVDKKKLARFTSPTDLPPIDQIPPDILHFQHFLYQQHLQLQIFHQSPIGSVRPIVLPLPVLPFTSTVITNNVVLQPAAAGVNASRAVSGQLQQRGGTMPPNLPPPQRTIYASLPYHNLIPLGPPPPISAPTSRSAPQSITSSSAPPELPPGAYQQPRPPMKKRAVILPSTQYQHEQQPQPRQQIHLEHPPSLATQSYESFASASSVEDHFSDHDNDLAAILTELSNSKDSLD